MYYDETNYHLLLLQALGGIGGIIALVEFSGFMSFCLWTTFMISGALVLLNVLNVYQALHTKFSFLTKVVIIVFLQLGLPRSQIYSQNYPVDSHDFYFISLGIWVCGVNVYPLYCWSNLEHCLMGNRFCKFLLLKYLDLENILLLIKINTKFQELNEAFLNSHS